MKQNFLKHCKNVKCHTFKNIKAFSFPLFVNAIHSSKCAVTGGNTYRGNRASGGSRASRRREVTSEFI